MNSYAIGTLVRVTGTFRDIITANLVDPTTVTFTIALPTKELEAVTVTKSSTGIYTADYTPVLKGNHVYKMLGNGTCQVGAYGTFNATGDF